MSSDLSTHCTAMPVREQLDHESPRHTPHVPSEECELHVECADQLTCLCTRDCTSLRMPLHCNAHWTTHYTALARLALPHPPGPVPFRPSLPPPPRPIPLHPAPPTPLHPPHTAPHDCITADNTTTKSTILSPYVQSWYPAALELKLGTLL